MTDRSLVDKVAEALKIADESGDPPEDEHYRDLAQAAIDALGLTPEFARRWITKVAPEGVTWEYGASVSNSAELAPRYGMVEHVTRLVTPWAHLGGDDD